MIRVSQTFTKEKDQVNTLLEVEGNSLINKQKFVMKTEYIDNDGDEINSIDLATGELDCLHEDAKVYPVDATLYVKE